MNYHTLRNVISVNDKKKKAEKKCNMGFIFKYTSLADVSLPVWFILHFL